MQREQTDRSRHRRIEAIWESLRKRALLANPAFREWEDAAKREAWTMPQWDGA
jgi:hypothetical protein